VFTTITNGAIGYAGGTGGGTGMVWGTGGGGGYCTRTFASGALTPGAVVTLTVGAGGSRGSGNNDGGLGARGEITVQWS